MTESQTPLMSPVWLRFAAFGLIAPLFVIVAFGTPKVGGVLATPWLVWSVAIFNAGCGVALLVMARKKSPRP